MTSSEWAVRWHYRHAVVTMPAEIDATNAASVETFLAQLSAERPEIISADLTGTTFCDSAGVRAITLAYQRAIGQGIQIRLVVGDSPVSRIFDLTGLDKILPIYPDVLQSLAVAAAEPR
jgi:anti-sigma B factor antagonist